LLGFEVGTGEIEKTETIPLKILKAISKGAHSIREISGLTGEKYHTIKCNMSNLRKAGCIQFFWRNHWELTKKGIEVLKNPENVIGFSSFYYDHRVSGLLKKRNEEAYYRITQLSDVEIGYLSGLIDGEVQ
jgi:predicted transcriptional regulator